MKFNRIDERISVCAQIAPEDVPEIAASGFRTVINNRPDGESPDQPARAAIRGAVEAAGMTFVDIPFSSGQQTPADVAAFAAALDEEPGPVFAYCRTGTRSTSIWAMTQAGRLPVDEILRRAASAGYDLSGLRPALEAIAAQGRAP